MGWMGEWQRRWVKMVRVSRVAHGGEVQQGGHRIMIIVVNYA